VSVKYVLAIVLVFAAVAVGVTSFRKTVTPYVNFTDARRSNSLVQVNGVLAGKQYVVREGDQFLKFRLRDANNEVMEVRYKGVIPGNFDQATNIVAIGNYRDGYFEAEQLLVKCPSKYQAEAEKAGKRG
jgi:cytochrome c-type biogenesis protein CcmE